MERLKPGVHDFSIEKFIETYCSTENRKQYIGAVSEVIEYAMGTNAKSVFVGGSFLTEKENPNDIDFLIAYDYDRDIPKELAKFISNIGIDIMFCSFEHKTSLDSYLHLFQYDRNGYERGVAQIKIREGENLYVPESSIDWIKFESIQKSYTDRKFIDREPFKGILISIHGILSKAEWNVDIAPIVSSQNWIFAPYVYSGNWPDLLFSPPKRKNTIEMFREWVYDVCERYSSKTTNLSIVAHSYGTYIIGKYLLGFDTLPVNLNSIILTGSILNTKYDWADQFNCFKVGRVLNIYSSNDSWVKHMRDSNWKKYIGMDTLFGAAGHKSFSSNHNYLIQRQLKILTHNNTIKRDVIETVWMPFLNNNHNSLNVNRHERQTTANSR
jgi:hypothetical protein